MVNKACSTCGVEKSLDQFQVRRASKDGLTASCKSCLRARDAARYPKEAERRAARHAEYVKTPSGRDARSRAVRVWQERHPLRRAAHIALGNAVRDGRVKPLPCFVCGKESEAHHPDYSRPLDVVWLCPAHHKQAHALAREANRSSQTNQKEMK